MSSQVNTTDVSNSYRSIFKATTLFGGVQLYQILIQIIRSKFLAVLLGTSGVGLQGLYQSSLQLVRSITSLGLSQSAVRDISEANGSCNHVIISKTVSTLRRFVWFTGLLGTISIICFSPILSHLTFGNDDYIIPLIFLSCTLLFDQLASGQTVLLQGLRRLRDLAKASAIGSTIGLFLSVPIYYLLGIKGIVPTLILVSITNLIISWLFARKIEILHIPLSIKETWDRGKNMIKMGLAFSVSGIIATGVTYVLKAFILRQGDMASVGLFQAGNAIITVYVSMVFNAVGTDFYPRLAAVNKDNLACRTIINQQGEIATQILAPILNICILAMPLIMRILYSDQFLEATPYVLWCCPGMMFKLASWLIAYQFIAKAESSLFIITETFANVIYLSLSIIGFKIGGLTGLGIAYTIDYFFYLLIVYYIAVKRYCFRFSKGFITKYLQQLCLVVGALLCIIIIPSSGKYFLCTLATILSCVYSLVLLNKKMNLFESLQKRIRNHKR